MFVTEIDINKYKQNIVLSKENKIKYGEINTPFSLINKMLDIFPEEVFQNPHLKWLDPCCGCGYFMIPIFHRLYKGLEEKIPDNKEREKHIIEKMLYMVEINRENNKSLISLFGEKANIVIFNFLSMDQNLFVKNSEENMYFDIIIGNPPYNSNGSFKVPTNKVSKKTADGKALWRDFTQKAISFLVPNGYLNFIIPSIWMKPDKSKMYDFLTRYRLSYMNCFTNTETNRIFCGEAQTPTCFFLLKNCVNSEIKVGCKEITLFDKDQDKYINYELMRNYPIPVFGVSIIQKLIPFIKKAGYIKVIKTNEPGRKSEFSQEKTEKFSFPCIMSAVFKKQEPIELEFKTTYSSMAEAYYGDSKLILAHKMYGFPIIDYEGNWGIARRDNYIILDKSKENLCKIRDFLSTYFALYVFESTRYRMKYLEKYAFQFLPNILELSDFPEVINDDTIADYFGFSPEEKLAILNLHKKKYFNTDNKNES